MNRIKLGKAVSYSSERICYGDLRIETYVSTDNLLPNKQGVTRIERLPKATLNTPKYNKGNILISNIRPYLKKIYYSKHDGGVSADVLTFVVKNGFDSKYIYYTLFQDAFFIHMMAGSKGTKMPRGDKRQILEFEIPSFDITNQKKIAAILSSLDDKIELNNQINTELEQMAKTLYEFWFVQFDFPNTKGKPYKSSGGKMVYNEVLKREIPEGWELGRLSSLATLNPSLSIKKNKVSPYIEMASIPTSGFMTTEPAQKEFSGGVKFQNGDIIIARITPCLENGKTALITMLDGEDIGFGSTEFINIRGKDKSYMSYLALMSRSELFRNYAISKMTGTSGRKRVDAKDLSNFQLAVPPENIIRNFGTVMDVIFSKMTSNTKQNQDLAALRDWLLPMLMNGQVKVIDNVESEVADVLLCCME